MTTIDPTVVAICGLALLLLYATLWHGITTSPRPITSITGLMRWLGRTGLWGGLGLLAASLVLDVLQRK